MTSGITQCTTLKLETGSKVISIGCQILHWTYVLFHVHMYVEPETQLCVPPSAENPNKGPSSQKILPKTDSLRELESTLDLKISILHAYTKSTEEKSL